MKGRISRRTLEELQQRSDITEIVAEYVVLNRSGSSLKGLCPFHDEKTPSFFVSRDKGVYHCFGCGAGGDQITFLMNLKKLDYREAVEELCGRYGIGIEYEGGPSRDSLIGRMLEAASFAADFYHGLLFQKGNPALSYLKKRGVSEETAREIVLGFGGSGKRDLLAAMKIKGLDLDGATECGLLYKREDGDHVDRFSGRLIFPIKTAGGKVAGFAGRSLDGREPKYINSAESRIYRKKNVLYGQNVANRHIRKEGRAYIVEGYMDWIALWQEGVRNVVATCGTAVTSGQFRAIKKVSGKVVLLLDGDRAGKKAAVRAVSPAYEAGISPLAFFPPHGLDPDDWLKKEGGEKVRKALDGARLLVEQIIEGAAKRFDLQEISQKMDYLDLLEKYVRCVKDPVEKALYVKKIAGLVDLPEGNVKMRFEGEKESPKKRVFPLDRVREVELKPEKALAGYLAKHPERAGDEDLALIIPLIRDRELVDLISDTSGKGGETDRGFESSTYIDGTDYSKKLSEAVILYERQFPEDREENLGKIIAYVRIKIMEEELGELRESLMGEDDVGTREEMLGRQTDLLKEIEKLKKNL